MRTPPINVYVLVFVLLYLVLFFVVAIPYITVSNATAGGAGGDLSHGFVPEGLRTASLAPPAVAT